MLEKLLILEPRFTFDSDHYVVRRQSLQSSQLGVPLSSVSCDKATIFKAQPNESVEEKLIASIAPLAVRASRQTLESIASQRMSLIVQSPTLWQR
jgi:hypothetical protein